MKKQSYLIGLICLLAGGLLGYFIGTQSTWKQTQEVTGALTGIPGAGGPASSIDKELPEGHPALTTPAEFETLKKAAEAAPNEGPLLTGLANRLYDAGRYDEAITYYQRALKLDPNNVNLITDMGTAFFYSGKPDEALAQYNRSLEIDPRHVQSLHNLVIVYVQGKKDAQAASQALDRLKAIDPSNPSIPSLQAMISKGAPAAANPRQRIF